MFDQRGALWGLVLDAGLHHSFLARRGTSDAPRSGANWPSSDRRARHKNWSWHAISPIGLGLLVDSAGLGEFIGSAVILPHLHPLAERFRRISLAPPVLEGRFSGEATLSA